MKRQSMTPQTEKALKKAATLLGQAKGIIQGIGIDAPLDEVAFLDRLFKKAHAASKATSNVIGYEAYCVQEGDKSSGLKPKQSQDRPLRD